MFDILKNIRLTKVEYEYLQFAYCDKGSEGFIIRTGSDMIKLFKSNFGQIDFSLDEIEEIRENKLSKLELLYSIKDKFDNRFYPTAIYSYQGKFVGYCGNWFSYPTFEYSYFGSEENIFYLKKIKEKLERFHELGIVYGDIKDDNILIDVVNKDIVFVDMDNIQVGDYPIDMMNYFVENFFYNYHDVDWKLDSYMMNLLTLDRLFCCSNWYLEVIEKLKAGFLPEELLRKKRSQVKKLAREMKFIDKNYSGKYFIDML